jgi:GxxExxY protein
LKRQGRQDAPRLGEESQVKEIVVPYEDEISPYALPEPSAYADELARRVIGAAIEVSSELGPGHLEEVYEEALAVEMRLRGIPFERQVPITIQYKGVAVGGGKLDFLVGGALIVEVKAVAALIAIHGVQVESYLAITGHELGLLINFNVLKLKDGGIRRIISSHPRPS